MIKKVNWRFLLHQIAVTDRRNISTTCVMMTLSKDIVTAGFCSFSRMYPASTTFRAEAKIPLDVISSFKVKFVKGLILKNCSNGTFRSIDEGFQKARAVAPHRKLVRDTETRIEENLGVKPINGHTACERGIPLEYPDRPMHEKLVVAVDVDEVLGSFLSALNKFIADRYFLNHSVSDYHVYEFCKIWNCSRTEADTRVHEFFKTHYFKTGIHPIPGAQRALVRLSTFCNLSIVTSRQNVIKDHTIEWIETHYPRLFQEIHFGNHFALDGQSRPKSEICRSLGAHVLIDDNPSYALECAEAGIRVLLFDYDNSYPWSKTGSADLHPLVTKVHNWQQVEQQLVSWIVS